LFPFIQRQSVGFEQCPNVPRSPLEKLVENGHHDAERAIAEHRTIGNSRELLVLGNRNREPVTIIDVQHDMNVRTAVADVDHAIRSDAQSLLELLDDRDLAVAGGHALDGADFARAGVEFQFGSINVLGRHYAGQSRSHDLPGRGGYHEEGKTIALGAEAQKFDQRRNRALEANAAPGLHQMFTTNAAELRIVPDQIGQLAALLYEIAARKAGDAVLEAGYSEQLAQHESGVLETQG